MNKAELASLLLAVYERASFASLAHETDGKHCNTIAQLHFWSDTS